MGSAGAATIGVSELAAGDSPGEPQAPSARRLIASREAVAGRATEGGGWGDIRKRGYPVRGPGEGAALALAGRSVVGAGFALPRDAGRRPAPGELASAPREGGALALAGRSVVGAGFALPRDAGRRPALQAPRFFAVGESRSRCASRSRAAVKPHREEQCHRCWFRAPARCRSETRAGRTGQRSRRVRHSRWQGAVLSALVSRSRAMPVGDRRSRPSPRFFAVGDARSRCASRSGAAVKPHREEQCCRRWFRAAARCRSEAGAPGPAE